MPGTPSTVLSLWPPGHDHPDFDLQDQLEGVTPTDKVDVTEKELHVAEWQNDPRCGLRVRPCCRNMGCRGSWRAPDDRQVLR
ncbi:hypothetical protein Are01nite_42860 [Actinoplanes regularis]|nr:hypothetical protein Are01nite_42860 [Actinoplanes regularis]